VAVRPHTRRWLIVAALFVVIYGVSVPLAAFGVFLPVLAEHFGWTRGAVSAALSLNLLVGGVAGFAVGALADRHGCIDVRPVALRLGNERVARHQAHGFDDARVADTARDDLLANHRFAGGLVRRVVQRSHLISATEAGKSRQARPKRTGTAGGCNGMQQLAQHGTFYGLAGRLGP